MGCFLAVLGLITPRVILAVLWIFTDYLTTAFATFFWPFIGFLFLPTATLFWAIAANSDPGAGLPAWGVVLVVVGLLFDLGVLGGGARRRAAAA